MCECCQRAKAGPGYAMFDPACLWCGARLIWHIQRKQISRAEKAQRCRQALEDWVHHGHGEEEVRRLAKMSLPPLAPLST